MKIYFIILIIILTQCSSVIHDFIRQTQGTYTLISDPKFFLSIDNSGSMSSELGLHLFFYQGISANEAIYTQKDKGKKYYTPIKIDQGILYQNTRDSSVHNISFENMTAFATKIR